MEKPWMMEIDEIAKQINSDLSNGLDDKEAFARLETYGYNRLAKKKKRHPVSVSAFLIIYTVKQLLKHLNQV
ncbi:MAG: cation-transporting P-type ATPase [Candidatus Omnitrophica bacterium]|nr:cation-transporting P-type ATPase [Candidatus Omnitrophota bacterium]